MGQCYKNFDYRFFLRISFPKPLSVPLSPFQTFSKFEEIFAAQGAPPVSLTPVSNGKFFNQKSFNYFAWTPLVVEVRYR